MYSTNEAAEKLGLSQDHVRLLARTGVIEAKKLGHDWVVLNLDYKRKRRSKGTKYFELTPSGRQAITILEEQGKDDEVKILRFLLKDRAAVQQISDEIHIDSSTVRLNLRQFKKDNWIKEKKAETQIFEEEIPEEVESKEKGLKEDNVEQQIPEEEESDGETPGEKATEVSQHKGSFLIYDF